MTRFQHAMFLIACAVMIAAGGAYVWACTSILRTAI